MDKIIHKLIEALASNGMICAAFLLGSAATDRMRPESDIDIAILLVRGRRPDDLQRISLATELSLAAGIPVDLGILSSDNLIYAKEAILRGKEIYCGDRKYTDLMTTALLGMYVNFQEERREVLNAYRT